MDAFYSDMRDPTVVHQVQVQSILTNDWEFIKIENFTRSPTVNVYRKWKRGDKDFMHAVGYDGMLPADYQTRERS